MPNMRAKKSDRLRVADVIRQRRIELGITQEHLADRSGLALRTVQNAETGQSVIHPLSRSKLERALGLSLGYLTEVYLSTGAVSNNSHGVEMGTPSEVLAPGMVELLNHPALTREQREFIISQLRYMSDTFAQQMSDMLSLNHNHRAES
jgi:transcriptional regulator with XRE-family HTH domain